MKTTTEPNRWAILLGFPHPETGEQITIASHECRDLLQARTLLSEMRELASDIAEWLPGLIVEGIEIKSFAQAVEENAEMSEDDKAHWRGQIAQEAARKLRKTIH